MEIKEIIDTLRVCADDGIICPACPHYDSGVYSSGAADCYQNLMQEAADTIESQQKCIAELEAALREREKPLTLGELRQMDGEPYYHVGLQADSPEPHWAILDPLVARCAEDYGYGKRWLAYRSKPKEDAK